MSREETENHVNNACQTILSARRNLVLFISASQHLLLCLAQKYLLE